MLIAIIGCVVMSDQLRAITPGPPTSWTMGVLAISWGVSIALVVIQVIAGQIALQRLQRTGSYVVVNRFDRIVLGSRWAGVLMHVIATLGLGSLNATREVIGNLVLLDEFLSSAPALLVIVAGWWASYAMDRLMREAALIGSLDRSRPVWDGPTRLGHVVMQVRHQVLLVLVPVSLLTALGETSPRLIQLVARWLEPLHGAAGDVGRNLDLTPEMLLAVAVRHVDHDLPRTRLKIGMLLHHQHLGTTQLRTDDLAHAGHHALHPRDGQPHPGH